MKKQSGRSYTAWMVGGLCLLLIAGCQSRDIGPTLFPVHGDLFIDDAPAAGASIRFLAIDGSKDGPVPAATVDENGRFAVSYRTPGDGLPAGKYNLVVYWLESPPEGGLPNDRLRGRFSNPQQPVATVTIQSGDNQLAPIHLRTTPTGRSGSEM